MPPVDGHRLTAFATNTTRGQLADLELRHRRRARCEDRIRNAKVPQPLGGPGCPHPACGTRPLHGFTGNQIWCEVVALAADLLAWLQLLGCTNPNDTTAHPARRWEPKRLRLRLLATAGRLAVSARHAVLHLTADGRWTGIVLAILTRLRAQRLTPTTTAPDPATRTASDGPEPTRAASGPLSDP